MDKQDFTLQAALTLLKASPDTPATLIASTAKVLADELFEETIKVKEPTDDAVNSFTIDIIEVIMEADRIDKSERAKRNFYHNNQYGIGIRIKKICKEAGITSVGELLSVGKIAFGKLPRVGKYITQIVSQALSNLYGTKSW